MPVRASSAGGARLRLNARRALGIVLLALSAPSAAEVAYVTDSLRLAIHRTQDASDKPFANLVSGTELEVLERTTNYARVRTPKGEEGWVKSVFLVPAKPAVLRVAELEAELAALKSGERPAASVPPSTEAPVAEHSHPAPTPASAPSAQPLREALGRLERENEAYEEQLERYRGSLPLPWVAAALVVALVGGFVSGLWWLDALIRRRHGGFRVY